MKIAFRNFGILVLVALLAFLLNVFFADSLVARIGTWHWVQARHLLDPRAPLVINTREEVRVSDGSDSVAAFNKSKNKVGAVVDMSNGQPNLRGSAVVATSDGRFITTTSVIAGVKPENLVIVMFDGARYPVVKTATDTAAGLSVLETGAGSLSVTSMAQPQDLLPLARILLLGANADGSPYVLSSNLSGSEHMPDTVVSSEGPSRTLPLQFVAGAMPGQAGFDLSGDLAGLWDGQRLISATIVQETLNSVLTNAGKVVRPSFGFSYRFVSSKQAALTKSTAGLLISKTPDGKPAVVPGGVAAKAGLLEGDVITKVGSQAVADTALPEVLLTTAPVAKQLVFEVVRQGKTLQFTLTPVVQ
jgi:S1-C subfamily serine protease